MNSSTVATLECAAQVSAAAITTHSIGSPVMAPSSVRTTGACSAGASVSSRICSASSIRPRPMATRPMSLSRLRPPLRKATRPITNSTGAAAAMLNDSSCTISVVPTLAPSMIASAGTSATMPSVVNEAVISAVAVLLCRSAVRPRPAAKAAKRLPSACERSRRRSGPKARRMPLWTMCRPHSRSATPPIRSSRTSVPISPLYPRLGRQARSINPVPVEGLIIAARPRGSSAARPPPRRRWAGRRVRPGPFPWRRRRSAARRCKSKAGVAAR